MNAVFADTSYFVALLLQTDSRHQRAVGLTSAHRGLLVTSEWVLAELGNFLSPRTSRRLFCELVIDLQNSAEVSIIAASAETFAAALTLYRAAGSNMVGHRLRFLPHDAQSRHCECLDHRSPF